MEEKKELLEKLDFGSVDSESESNLNKKFIMSKDFIKFSQFNIALVLGAKGSEKSALFQMFSKYEETAKIMAGISNKNVAIVTGTGFKDLKELSTEDFIKIMADERVNFDQIWELYIAIKIAIKPGMLGYSGEYLKEFYNQAGLIDDLRVFAIVRQLFSLIVGTPPTGIDIDIKGLKIKVGGKKSIDTQDILIEIEELLEQEQMDCWILFDKIDELFSDNYVKRKNCIESLFRTYLNFVHRFPRIKFKIFLRNDIWNTLEFVNKSHISDKTVELKWDKLYLLEMVLKRIILDSDILNYIENELGLSAEEIVLSPNLEA